MIWFFYYLLIYLFAGGMRMLAIWNPKARLWVNGRKNWQSQLENLPQKSHHRIWFHVSSLGEFEQARPVIEKLKASTKELEVILTFFSPSGFTIRSDYSLARVFYLPADLPGHADTWLSMVEPDLAVFVKYDLWPGFLKSLKKRNIPAILFSAHWVRGQTFASYNLPPTRSLLFGFNQIFLQHGKDLEYFRRKGFSNISVAGDTRIDRCLVLPKESMAKIPESLLALAPFDLVAGSTWPPDEKLLIELRNQLSIRILIAPHDVSKENIDRLFKVFQLKSIEAVRFSDLDTQSLIPDVVVIDSIGMLAYLYSLGHVAYIGGGFGSGIHNILEPMAHGKPVIFGPAYKRFPEAQAMVEAHAGIPIRNGQDLTKALNHFKVAENREKAGKDALQYLQKQKGASDKVFNYIMESIPFGSE